ncbi:MAG TPA: HipA family kinase [Bryobacteraceae bacterium]|nr:HipA family kinase [Bryobacteraceae bacterium]
MPIDARRFIRKMRGGAQAHLLEASDGGFYVVKFRNNPQHGRILVNEWIASAFLDYLGLAAPRTALVRVSQLFLDENPEVHFQLGSGRAPVEPGWHFGSQYPGDPSRTVVYDFLPDTLLDRVENLADFRGALAFDKWMGNADARQSIFFRARLRESLRQPLPGFPTAHVPSTTPRLGFVAQMMDNGFVFEGPHWRLIEAPLQGLYFRPLVYRSVRGLADFEPWLSRIRHFPEEVVDRAVKQIPENWLEGNRLESGSLESSPLESNKDALDKLLNQLLRRRSRVADLIVDSRAARPEHFPEWRSAHA